MTKPQFSWWHHLGAEQLTERTVTPDPLHCSSPQNHQPRVGTSHHIKVPARSSWPFRSPYPGQILPSTRAGRENQVQCSIKQRACSAHRKGKEKRKYSRDMVINMHFTNQMSVKIKFTWLARVILHGGHWHIKLQSTGEMEGRAKSLYLKE